MKNAEDIRAQIHDAIRNYDTRLLRKVLNITHATLDAESGIGRATLHRWESAKAGRTNGDRMFRTRPTVEKYKAYLKRKRGTIRDNLNKLDKGELLELMK